jgi:hypothetical protein
MYEHGNRNTILEKAKRKANEQQEISLVAFL